MAKIRILSDLHIDFSPFRYEYLGEDIIVIAGDTREGIRGFEWMISDLCEKSYNIPIVAIPGNHDYYGQDVDKFNQAVADLTKGTNVHCAPFGTFEYNDLVFIAHPYWVDFNLYGNVPRDSLEWKYSLADSTYMFQNKQHISTDYFPQENQKAKDFIRGEYEKYPDKKKILVTHYFPEQSIHPFYKNDPLNPGFASRWPDDILYGCDVLIHGHTHKNIRLQLEDGPLIICNPRGYVMRGPRGESPENREFNQDLVIVV